MAAAEQLLDIGIKVDIEGMSWDEIMKVMFSEAVLMGWGSSSPNEITDTYLDAAMSALTVEEANENWKKVQWDGVTGTAMQGECPWVWIVNLDHVTYVRDGLSIGSQPIHGHGHGLPLIQNLNEWSWTK